MNHWTADRLDQIDALYPPARLEAAKQRWSAIWDRRMPAGRYPYVFAPMLYQPYDDFEPPAGRLATTLNDLVSRGVFQDDAIPAVFPGCLQTTLPNMFGAGEVLAGRDAVAERIVRRAEDVDDLSWSLGPGTIAYDWLEAARYYVEETDGRLPVHVVDMQGPFDAAAQLSGYELLMTMAYDDPARYRRFMEIMSEAFVALWNEQARILGDLFVPTHLFAWDWLPADRRATLSMDSLVMFSPTFFEEFVEPHLRSLADRLGSLVVHSCGDFRHMIPLLCGTGYADVGVYGPYPMDEEVRGKPSGEWAPQEREHMLATEEAILDACR